MVRDDDRIRDRRCSQQRETQTMYVREPHDERSLRDIEERHQLHGRVLPKITWRRLLNTDGAGLAMIGLFLGTLLVLLLLILFLERAPQKASVATFSSDAARSEHNGVRGPAPYIMLPTMTLSLAAYRQIAS